MTARIPKTDPRRLPDVWHRWTTVVGLFARRRHARLLVADADYAALRRDIHACCRELTRREPARADFYRRLDDLAGPWLDCPVLEQADRGILLDVWEQARAADRDLGGRGIDWPACGRVLVGLALVLFLVGGLAAACWLATTRAESVGRWWWMLTTAVRGLSRTQIWLVLGLLVALAGGLLMRITGR